MSDIRVCFLACFYRTECHTTEPRPCDSVRPAPAPALADLTDSLSLITTVLRDHGDRIVKVGDGQYETRCWAGDWSQPVTAESMVTERGAHARHRAEVLRDALIAAGWREPEVLGA